MGPDSSPQRSHSLYTQELAVGCHEGVAGMGLDDADTTGSPSLLQADLDEHDRPVPPATASYTAATSQAVFSGGGTPTEQTVQVEPLSKEVGI